MNTDETQKSDPPVVGDEASTLLSFLERQRATFAWKSGGLDERGLRATLGQSAMTLGGMLKHLARFEDDMSSEWILGEGQLSPWNEIDWETNGDWDWRSANEESAEHLYARWHESVAHSRVVIARAIADVGLGADVDDDSPTLRYVLLNMIEEYARHNGHADMIRESVDGLVGQDPPV